MKPTLQLRIGHHLTMTPQLQQAIRLLQLSTLDLKNEIQEALDSNPMLEVSEEDGQNQGNTQDSNSSEAGSTNTTDTANSNTDEKPTTNQENETIDLSATDNIPDDLPVDSDWEDVYQSSMPASTNSSSSGSGEDYNFEERNGTTESLYDHLMWQLNLTPFSDTDRVIAMAIIEAIDDRGYLTVTAEDVLETVRGEEVTHSEPSDPDIVNEGPALNAEYQYPNDENKNSHDSDYQNQGLGDVERDEVEAVLHRIQQFDPPGVAARDLSECIVIQLKQLPLETPYSIEAQMVAKDYLKLLGARDYTQIMRKAKLRESDLKAIIDLIQTLNPTPGDQVTPSTTEYVIPDVIVTKREDSWSVELNPDTAPKLGINSGYAALVKRADNSDSNNYLRNNLQEARWFIKSLQSRNETLLKVSTKIVEHQKGFFEYGEEAMKPLVLHDIAEAVEMHESTISRVTTQKFMHTPQGIFELKYFFSSHVGTTSGGECSSTAIRAMIKKLVNAENPKKPLSDSKIANFLADQQIKVARRTIAKYRESMNIPPSNERKRLV
ncbi:MAG: RNA polymerase factor sigma-54 [Pseudomonadales bacterium]|nr:RNA polymerase factor sigma-54 [Pseudomonadales bacterium]